MLVDLHGLRQAARRRLWVVVLTSIMGLLAAGYLVWNSTPTFTATATIRMADSRRALAGGLVGKQTDDRGAENDPVLTEMQVLLSRSVAGRVATGSLGAMLRVRTMGLPALALTNVRVDSAAGADSIALTFQRNGVSARAVNARGGSRVVQARYGQPLSVAGVTFTVPANPGVESGALTVQSFDQTVQRLVRGTSATRRPGTNIVDVTYRGNIPEVVQQTANSLALAFQEVNRENAMQQSLQRREFLGKRVAQTDALLQSARDSLSAFRASPAVSGVLQAAAKGTGASTTPGASAAAEAMRLEVENQLRAQRVLVQRLEEAATRDDGAGMRVAMAMAPTGTVSPAVSQLADRVSRLQGARDSLTTGRWARASTHPEVVRLNTLLQSARGELLEAARGQLHLLEDETRSLGSASRREQATMAALPALQAEEQRLAERTATYERLAQQLREEYQRAQIEEAAESGDIQLVDTAVRPRATDGIAAWRQLLFGLLLGLGAGVALAYLMEQLDTTLRREEDMEEQLGVTSLGTVPSFAAAARAGRPHFARLRRRRRKGGRRRLPSIVQRQNSPADAGWAPGDAFRALHTNLLFADPRGMPRSLVVTSAVAGEGKTTVAVNLAICVAQHGGRVLLLDGDLHRPQLHAAFGVPREGGLTELVHDDRPWGEVVHSTDFAGLYVLTAGRSMGREPGLLRSMAVRRALVELTQAFDIVIIDGPPVLYTADAAIISAVADGVIIVASAGFTDRADCRTAVRMLRQVGAQLVGSVLNDPDAHLHDHHYERYGYSRDTRALAGRV
jgi:capsular exopolysaccharide synthesis family protein